MPLITLSRARKEAEYAFTHCEMLALDYLPPEQVKSTNHVEHLIDRMLEDEVRDADPEHNTQDIYRALGTGDLLRVLAASKNLTIAEKNRVVQGIYINLLAKAKDSDTVMTAEDVKRLALIVNNPSMDLFHLCVQI